MSKVKLHLGCGNQYLEGYTNIDFRGEKLDKRADIRMMTWGVNQVDEIRLHHVYEHFSRVVAVALLIRWTRWLKDKGKLIIEVPDFEASIKDWDRKYPAQKAGTLRHLTGDQSEKWGFHKELWTPDRLEHLLHSMGFFHVVITRRRRPTSPHLCDFTATAVKASSLPIGELVAAGRTFLRQSMVAKEEEPTAQKWEKQLRGMVYDNVYPFSKCNCNNAQKTRLLNSVSQ